MGDILFAADMMVTFRTAFINAEGLVNTVPAEIRKNYFAFWFIIDFFSTFPIDQIVEACVATTNGSAGQQTRALKLVRIVRLARLLKLARLAKMGKLVEVLEHVVDLSPLAMKCFKLGGRLTVMAHLLGCFWYYTTVHADLSA